jgi:hypothetical protein
VVEHARDNLMTRRILHCYCRKDIKYFYISVGYDWHHLSKNDATFMIFFFFFKQRKIFLN